MSMAFDGTAGSEAAPVVTIRDESSGDTEKQGVSGIAFVGSVELQVRATSTIASCSAALTR